MKQDLKIGIPSKGRLAEQASSLLNQAGIRFRRPNRSLFAKAGQFPVDITFLRPRDIPLLCSEGAIDLGITGQDLVEESGAETVQRLRLGIGGCRLAVCVPENFDADVPQLDGKKIATSFPNITRKFLAEHDASAHLVPLSGSVEVMIQLGVADAIVDLVETGSTLAANQLKILTEIGSYESVLIQRPGMESSDLVNRVVRRLEGVVIARSYSLLEYNIARELLAAAEKITPGFDSPTISSLEDESMCAVRVMVANREIIETMEQLEQLGASAILQVPIENCRL
ncbi:MAG: ATP phosphoribosyltransferase [Mariniblastus sp.]|nr:ATP phosphoribosyltransferase [Mariniblastus sp.]